MIGAKLDFVAFFGCGCVQSHHPSIIHQHIQLIRRRTEGLGSFLHRREGGKVKLEERDVRLGDFFLDLGDGGLCF